MSSDDVQAIKAACEKLTGSLQEFSSRLYSQAGTGESEQDTTDTSGTEQEETVDAEFSDQGEV